MTHEEWLSSKPVLSYEFVEELGFVVYEGGYPFEKVETEEEAKREINIRMSEWLAL